MDISPLRRIETPYRAWPVRSRVLVSDMLSRLLPLAVVAALTASAPAAAQTLQTTGSAGQTASLDAAAVAALPRVSVPLSIHGADHVFEGPLLLDVLKAVGAETGRDLRGPALAQAVIVRATDGYAVVFGLAELDPGTRPNRIILADRMDGAPLPTEDGPYRLVAEGDLRPARSARQVTSVEVRRLAEPAPATDHAH